MSNINTAWKTDGFPFVQKAFDFEYANCMNKLAPLISEVMKKGADYRMQGMGGYGELPAYNGSTLVSLNQRRGFIKIVQTAENSAAIDIFRKYAREDLTGEASKAGKRAAWSAYMTVYMAVLRMFGNAFNANQLGADGVPWASAAHPIASKGDSNGLSVSDSDAGTFSNLLTDAMSVAAITKAQTTANRFVTPDGLPFMCDFNTLLVSPELEPKAKEICGTTSALMPTQLQESANIGGANPIYGMQYIVVGGGADGFSAKQWAVCDRKFLKEVTAVVYGEKPTVLETELDNPLVQRIVPYVDFGVGFADARPIVFSNPA